MKIKNLVLLFALSAVVIIGCDKDEINQFSGPPTNVSAAIDIAQDDSGLVTFTPSGENTRQFLIDHGDGSSQSVANGNVATHTYVEGTYNVVITASNGTGETTEFSQSITISFAPPSNLMAGITVDGPTVTVAPTAANAMKFDVYFGEDANETPISVMAGGSMSNTYTQAGDYTVRVVAMSASVTTIETSETITIATGANPITFPVDFESTASVNYSFLAFGPDGDHATVIDNPDMSGINTSGKVVQFNKVDGAEVWAGHFFTLGGPIDFTNNNQVKVKVWSPKAGAQIKLKVENSTDVSIAYERDLNITDANTWEELTYDFSGIDATQAYDRVVLFFDFGNMGDNSNYYYDDVQLAMTAMATCDDETSSNVNPADGNINWTFQMGGDPFDAFGNIGGQVVANPVIDGINTSCNVFKYTKTAGCETWSGVGTGLDAAIDLTSSNATMFSMMVMAETHTTEVTLRLEFEPFPNVDPAVDIVQTISQVGVWEKLDFDFSAHTDKTFKSMIIYFDRNQACDDAVYYFDNLVQSVPSDCVEETAHNIDVANGDINWTFMNESNPFDAFGNIASGIVDNPVVDAVNNSCKVQHYTKTAGCETWSGTGLEIPTAIDMSTAKQKFSLKVLAETHTTAVTLRLERLPFPDVDPAVDVVQNISATGQWEELVFDFSGHDMKTFKSIIIYFDRDQQCDDAVYYFDDLKQVD